MLHLGLFGDNNSIIIKEGVYYTISQIYYQVQVSTSFCKGSQITLPYHTRYVRKSSPSRPKIKSEPILKSNGPKTKPDPKPMPITIASPRQNEEPYEAASDQRVVMSMES